MKFSPSNSQFYPDDFGYREDIIPGDVIDVPQEDFIAAMTREVGDLLAVEDGRIVILPAPQTEMIERSIALERFWRSQRLAETDFAVTRHRDELENGDKSTLSAEQYLELQAYRRSLRNWPEAGEFPLIEHRPSTPEWLLNLSQ